MANDDQSNKWGARGLGFSLAGLVLVGAALAFHGTIKPGALVPTFVCMIGQLMGLYFSLVGAIYSTMGLFRKPRGLALAGMAGFVMVCGLIAGRYYGVI